MGSNPSKEEGASDVIDYTCETCGSKFPSLELLELHGRRAHNDPAKLSPEEKEPLNFEPGGPVADFETGPRPGGKMDRETSRPAKGWETPGEEGDPRRGVRNQGVAPEEIPDSDSEPSSSRRSKKNRTAAEDG